MKNEIKWTEIECSPYELSDGTLIPVKFKYYLNWETKKMAREQTAHAGANTSTFDPDVFLSQEIVGANETKYTPPPEGEYKVFVDDLALGDYEGQPILQVTYAILDETGKLAEMLSMEKPTVRDSIFLDVENGALIFGPNKNVKLGKLREAAGQNDPRLKWNFNMLRGVGPLMIMIAHNFKNGEGPFARVTKVVKAS